MKENSVQRSAKEGGMDNVQTPLRNCANPIHTAQRLSNRH